MIPCDVLRQTYLNSRMAHYFGKKLASLQPEEITLRIDEFLKFINLAVHTSGSIPVSREIDEVWHYWVLQTEEYAALCARLPGGLFVNHSSNDYEEFDDPDATTRPPEPAAMLAFLGAYVKNYGPFESGRVRHWPFALRMMDVLGWTVDELNARLLACVGPPAADSGPAAASPNANQNSRQPSPA